jgi:hypothetical protein
MSEPVVIPNGLMKEWWFWSYNWIFRSKCRKLSLHLWFWNNSTSNCNSSLLFCKIEIDGKITWLTFCRFLYSPRKTTHDSETIKRVSCEQICWWSISSWQELEKKNWFSVSQSDQLKLSWSATRNESEKVQIEILVKTKIFNSSQFTWFQSDAHR